MAYRDVLRETWSIQWENLSIAQSEVAGDVNLIRECRHLSCNERSSRL
jgi:hypothetical protein